MCAELVGSLAWPQTVSVAIKWQDRAEGNEMALNPENLEFVIELFVPEVIVRSVFLRVIASYRLQTK